MKKLTLSLLLVVFSTATAFAQTATTGTAPAANGNSASNASAAIPAPPAINANSTPVELARAALAAQGGDKFKNVKNIWLVGSVDLYAPNSARALPGKFSLVTAGPKMRLDVDAEPVFQFKQIYDGQQSYSSMPGVEMPPADRFGLPVLAKYDQPGFTVSGLPDKKKLRGFRIVDSARQHHRLLYRSNDGSGYAVSDSVWQLHFRHRELEVQRIRRRAGGYELFAAYRIDAGHVLCRIQS